MIIFPAIDLSGGNAVRLFQGDYNNMKVYSNSPQQVAGEFVQKGARALHIVDLDGAKDGALTNMQAVKAICANLRLEIQVGGGIRTESRIESYLQLGVSRVILGTAAVKNFDFVIEMVKKYKDAIAVGIDAKNGMTAVNGWLETTAMPSVELCKKCADAGVKTVIYTDISKDGAMQGTNLEIYNTLSEIKNLNIIASGGVSYLNEIKALSQKNVYGAIVGKALYEGLLTLEACITEADK